MPVEFCTRCKTLRIMNMARSRIRLQLKSGKTEEVTTRTYYCGSCRSFHLCHEQQKERPMVNARARAGAAAIFTRNFLILLIFFLLASCQTVPITKRHQLSLIPAETILPMSFNQYKDFLAKNTVVKNTPEAQLVERTGRRIAQAVERYFSEHGLSKELEGYAWEFNLIEDKTVNAWCMPGGKVVVYSGIIPVAGDETGLAVVMGHEIAHAVANHGDERMSQGLLTEMGGLALSAALSNKPNETNQLFQAAYGLGAQVGLLLPYSRLHESEADHLGLIFMAMAGYDPQQAVPFWQRMAAQAQGSPRPPEFLSTHPTGEKRIENIKKLMPEAMKHYKA